MATAAGMPGYASPVVQAYGLVLMDIRMPGTDGLAATQAISADPDLAESPDHHVDHL